MEQTTEMKERTRDNFIKLYKEVGVSQKIFGYNIGLTQPQISRILIKTAYVPVAWLKDIKDFYHVDLTKKKLSLVDLPKINSIVKRKPKKRMYRVNSDVAKSNFVELFKNSGLSQRAFAKELSVNVITIRAILTENKYPSDYLIEAIKKSYNMDILNDRVDKRIKNGVNKIYSLFVDLYKKSELTQTKFGDSLGFDGSAISRFLSGERPLTKEAIQTVKDIYGVDLYATTYIDKGRIETALSPKDIRTQFLKLYYKSNLTNAEFAEMIGISKELLSKIIKGESDVSSAVILSVKKNTGIRLAMRDTETIDDSSRKQSYVFLVNNNTVPIEVTSEKLAIDKKDELDAMNINFKVYKQVIL